MNSAILVHPDFDAIWPYAADHFHDLWAREGPVRFQRLVAGDRRPVGEILADPSGLARLALFEVPLTSACLARMPRLREVVAELRLAEEVATELEARGVRRYRQPSEGAWGETVAEYALALTLCGLRRIPQLHRAILASQEPWDYSPPGGVGQAGGRGQQFGDDPRFTCGTLQGKRVRIVGVGNIGSRYASFCRMLGADVAAWDPFASDPCFHRAGARREWYLDHLVHDAEVFAPMLPLTDSTREVVTAEHLRALPKGCLVVVVTRAKICHVPTLRERVLADELALAADVFDKEPLPLDDPLLGRDNVVHTPHNAGRTIDANREWAQLLADQFRREMGK